jgi:hypothetical protein
MSADDDTREALVQALRLLHGVRGKIRYTHDASWHIAFTSLVVLIDQHDGRYLPHEAHTMFTNKKVTP